MYRLLHLLIHLKINSVVEQWSYITVWIFCEIHMAKFLRYYWNYSEIARLRRIPSKSKDVSSQIHKSDSSWTEDIYLWAHLRNTWKRNIKTRNHSRYAFTKARVRYDSIVFRSNFRFKNWLDGKFDFAAVFQPEEVA